jgi:hypothetical protein
VIHLGSLLSVSWGFKWISGPPNPKHLHLPLSQGHEMGVPPSTKLGTLSLACFGKPRTFRMRTSTGP